jgi:phospholipase C
VDAVTLGLSELGLSGALGYMAVVSGAGRWWAVPVAVAVGAASEMAVRCRLGPGRLLLHLTSPWVSACILAHLLEVAVDPVVAAGVTAGGAALLAGTASRPWSTAVAVVAGLLGVAVTAQSAGAWSVDEPAATDPAMVAGNGIVVRADTHAFLVQQAVVILRHDGRGAVAGFLSSPDRTAPLVRRGPRAGRHEDYTWRLQLGARDADRRLKARFMPDHFFNWWTHSGKGLIAGPSAATWAEQQFADAVRLWRSGDRAASMYHLGAATHLVDDACTPPHESQLVPNHRAYEEWVLRRQRAWAVTGGGIYRRDFRVRTGHGGPEWSSSHTRGWVDECAHRAAELAVNTAQPPDLPGTVGSYARTEAHFKATQRLTAGYLAFFFQRVGGP